MTSLRGQLLVASPALVDPNFARTVVLIAEHSDDGALGVVLNRPAEAAVVDAIPVLEGVVDDEEPVFVGGPVQPTGVLLVAEFEDPDDSARIIFEDIGFLVSGIGDEDAPTPPTGRVRVFAGHSGWGPGQLEAELEREDWIVEPAVRGDVFADDDEHLWSAVLKRKGGKFALLARMPPDPSVN